MCNHLGIRSNYINFAVSLLTLLGGQVLYFGARYCFPGKRIITRPCTAFQSLSPSVKYFITFFFFFLEFYTSTFHEEEKNLCKQTVVKIHFCPFSFTQKSLSELSANEKTGRMINALVGVEFLEIRDSAPNYNSCGAYRADFFTSVSNMTPQYKEVRDFSQAKHSTFLTSCWFFQLSNAFYKKRFSIAFHYSISAKISPVSKRGISFIDVFYLPGEAPLEFMIFKKQSKAFVSCKWLQSFSVCSGEQRKPRNRIRQITKNRFVIHLFTKVG